jgi:hypothetical protein
MATFTLQTGRKVDKPAEYCVATKCNGRWSHQFFKTFKGAQNEIRFLRNSSGATRDYYGIEDFQLIKPD